LTKKDISGDSIPRIKYAVDENSHNTLEAIPENNIARAGSECIFTRTSINDSVLAIVIRTGYNTEKGKLLRTIFMPKIIKFRFFEEAMMFVYIMIVVSIIGSIIYLVYQLYFLTEIKFTVKKIVLNILGLFFSTVKPVLPFSLYIGLAASKDKLTEKGILCSNKYKINECGRTDTIFFDKTGTITKDNSIFNGMYISMGEYNGHQLEQEELIKISTMRDGNNVDQIKVEQQTEKSMLKIGPKVGSIGDIQIQSQIFHNIIAGTKRQKQEPKDGFHFSNKIETVTELHKLGEGARNYLICLSFCNNLIKSCNKVVGDSIDTEMFKFAPYELTNNLFEDTKVIKKQYNLRYNEELNIDLPSGATVEKIFDYSSDSKSEGILLKDNQNRYLYVIKGAPETVASVCDPKTLPLDFNSTLFGICSTGVRVLGFAIKEFKDMPVNITRSVLEQDMTFCGLFALDNPIKNEAPEVIHTLTGCHIRCLLITGDNIFTAISVAVKSNIIPHDKNLYLGDLVVDPLTGKQTVSWATFDYRDLIPAKQKDQNDFFADDDLIEESKVAVPHQTPQQISSINDLINIDTNNSILAITGNAYDYFVNMHNPQLSQRNKSLFTVLHKICLVYGRFDAYQKSRVIKIEKIVKATKYPICYIGDGANDTEAMKHSDVSLLINHPEFSFTSQFSCADGDLNKVIELIKEGKNNVESGYQNFKFFIYLTCGQFVATFLLFLNYIGFNIYQTMFMDIAVFMVLSGMSDTFWHKPKINHSKPKSSILVFNILFPLLCHLVLISGLLIVAYNKLKSLSFYKPPHMILSDEDKQDLNIDLESYKFYDNHFLFCLMNLFFISYFVFSNWDSQFRVKLVQNTKPIIYIFFFFVFMIYLCNLSEVNDPNFIDEILIKFFSILRTYRTNRIYIAITVTYWIAALFVEKISDTIYFYQEHKKFDRTAEAFVQRHEQVEMQKKEVEIDSDEE
jgi:cation-transporting ATPase 13A2